MPGSRFEAEVRDEPGLAVVVLSGDIDRDAEADLAAAYVAAGAASVILLDFSAVGYINSTGIALIVRFLADGRRDRREIRACGLSPHYAEIFELTRLSDYMRIFDDAASASALGIGETAGGRP
ncbi:MAG TPA: STAS domain-containing protein [Solirubrobacteraceae bacterium]|nr:STAS domain-containing protein [Solirubrobacteraceae bacterium]